MKPQPHINNISSYTPGAQPEDESWIKLNTNENPYPPSPKVEAAISSEISRLPLYPHPQSYTLRYSIADKFKIDTSNVIIGNGSDDILNLLIRVYCSDQLSAGMTYPSYSLYPILTGIQNGKFIKVKFDRDMILPVEKIIESKANIFFLTSPNAPTGIGFSNDKIAEILDKFSGLLVVDEAYADFAEENSLELIKKYSNLFITRSFSKSYSLAGLRVGFGIGSPEIIKLLDRVRDSYNVNRLSQAGALAALDDPLYYQATIGKIIRSRNFYYAEFQNRNWFTYQSQSNFLFTEPVNTKGNTGADVANHLFQYLKENKILVRYFDGNPLTDSFLRISIGDDSQMNSLMEAIDSWLEKG